MAFYRTKSYEAILDRFNEVGIQRLRAENPQAFAALQANPLFAAKTGAKTNYAADVGKVINAHLQPMKDFLLAQNRKDILRVLDKEITRFGSIMREYVNQLQASGIPMDSQFVEDAISLRAKAYVEDFVNEAFVKANKGDFEKLEKIRELRRQDRDGVAQSRLRMQRGLVSNPIIHREVGGDGDMSSLAVLVTGRGQPRNERGVRTLGRVQGSLSDGISDYLGFLWAHPRRIFSAAAAARTNIYRAAVDASSNRRASMIVFGEKVSGVEKEVKGLIAERINQVIMANRMRNINDLVKDRADGKISEDQFRARIDELGSTSGVRVSDDEIAIFINLVDSADRIRAAKELQRRSIQDVLADTDLGGEVAYQKVAEIINRINAVMDKEQGNMLRAMRNYKLKTQQVADGATMNRRDASGRRTGGAENSATAGTAVEPTMGEARRSVEATAIKNERDTAELVIKVGGVERIVRPVDAMKLEDDGSIMLFGKKIGSWVSAATSLWPTRIQVIADGIDPQATFTDLTALMKSKNFRKAFAKEIEAGTQAAPMAPKGSVEGDSLPTEATSKAVIERATEAENKASTPVAGDALLSTFDVPQGRTLVVKRKDNGAVVKLGVSPTSYGQTTIADALSDKGLTPDDVIVGTVPAGRAGKKAADSGKKTAEWLTVNFVPIGRDTGTPDPNLLATLATRSPEAAGIVDQARRRPITLKESAEVKLPENVTLPDGSVIDAGTSLEAVWARMMNGSMLITWPITADSLRMAADMTEALGNVISRYAPHGIKLRNTSRRTTWANLKRHLAGKEAELPIIHDILRQIDTDPRGLPMFYFGRPVYALSKATDDPKGVGINQISIGEGDFASPSHFQAIHEIGHWAYANLLTPQEQATFLRSLTKYADASGNINPNTVIASLKTPDSFIIETGVIPNVSANLNEIFAWQFSNYVFSRVLAWQRTTDELAGFWKKIIGKVRNLVLALTGAPVEPEMLPIFERILPRYYTDTRFNYKALYDQGTMQMVTPANIADMKVRSSVNGLLGMMENLDTQRQNLARVLFNGEGYDGGGMQLLKDSAKYMFGMIYGGGKSAKGHVGRLRSVLIPSGEMKGADVINPSELFASKQSGELMTAIRDMMPEGVSDDVANRIAFEAGMGADEVTAILKANAIGDNPELAYMYKQEMEAAFQRLLADGKSPDDALDEAELLALRAISDEGQKLGLDIGSSLFSADGSRARLGTKAQEEAMNAMGRRLFDLYTDAIEHVYVKIERYGFGLRRNDAPVIGDEPTVSAVSKKGEAKKPAQAQEQPASVPGMTSSRTETAINFSFERPIKSGSLSIESLQITEDRTRITGSTEKSGSISVLLDDSYIEVDAPNTGRFARISRDSGSNPANADEQAIRRAIGDKAVDAFFSSTADDTQRATSTAMLGVDLTPDIQRVTDEFAASQAAKPVGSAGTVRPLVKASTEKTQVMADKEVAHSSIGVTAGMPEGAPPFLKAVAASIPHRDAQTAEIINQLVYRIGITELGEKPTNGDIARLAGRELEAGVDPDAPASNDTAAFNRLRRILRGVASQLANPSTDVQFTTVQMAMMLMRKKANELVEAGYTLQQAEAMFDNIVRSKEIDTDDIDGDLFGVVAPHLAEAMDKVTGLKALSVKARKEYGAASIKTETPPTNIGSMPAAEAGVRVSGILAKLSDDHVVGIARGLGLKVDGMQPAAARSLLGQSVLFMKEGASGRATMRTAENVGEMEGNVTVAFIDPSKIFEPGTGGTRPTNAELAESGFLAYRNRQGEVVALSAKSITGFADALKMGFRTEGAPGGDGSVGVIAMNFSEQARPNAMAVEQSALAGGAPEGIARIAGKLWKRNRAQDGLQADEMNEVRKFRGIQLSENSQRMRRSGAQWLADLVKPVMGTGFGDRLDVAIAKDLTPITNAIDQLAGVTGWISRSAKEIRRNLASHKNGIPQSETEERIANAMRRGDISGLAPEERAVVAEIDRRMKSMLRMQQEVGIPVGDVTGGRGLYLPQRLNIHWLTANRDEAIKRLARWMAKDSGDDISETTRRATKVVNEAINNEELKGIVDGASAIYAQAFGDKIRQRSLRIEGDDWDYMAPLFDNNLKSLVISYTEMAHKRVQWSKTFGIKGHGAQTYMDIAANGTNAAMDALLGRASNMAFVPFGEDAVEGAATLFRPLFDKPEEASSTIGEIIDQLRESGSSLQVRKELADQLVAVHAQRYGSDAMELSHFKHRAEAVVNGLADFGQFGTTVEKREIDFMMKMVGALGGRPAYTIQANEGLRTMARGLRTFNSVTLLSMSALASLADTGLSLVRGGSITSWMNGLRKSAVDLCNDPEYAAAMGRIGIGIESILNENIGGVSGGLGGRISNAFFWANGLTAWTEMNRKISAMVGFEMIKNNQAIVQRARDSGNTDTRKYRAAMRQLRQLGLAELIDAEPLVNIVEATRNDRISEALHRFVQESVFQPDRNDVPVWAQDPIGGMFFQLKSFPVMMSRLVKRSFKEAFAVEDGKYAGDPSSLMYLFTIGAALGIGTAYVRDVAQGRNTQAEDGNFRSPRERSLSKVATDLGWIDKGETLGMSEDLDTMLGWYLEGIFNIGGFGFLGELFFQTAVSMDNGAYGRERIASQIFGPSFGFMFTDVPTIVDGAITAIGMEEGDPNGKARQAVRKAISRVPFVGQQGTVREPFVDWVAGEAQN